MKHLLAIISVVLLLMAASVTQAQGILWAADYFNNPYLYGNPTIRQQVSGIGFSWGAGSPGANVPADNFTARYTTTAYFNSGTYRFSLTADDGVHLIVDGQMRIDTFANPRVGEQLIADIAMSAGYHSVQVDYLEKGGEAYVFANWTQLSVTPPPSSGGAWLAQYYNNRSLSDNPYAIMSEANPTHDWGNGSPMAGIGADNFSVRWSSTQNFNAGTYRLSVTVDDGVRVWVNGVRVLDEWHLSSSNTYTRDIQLNSGSNSIIIEYYEETGQARITYSLVPAGGGSTPTGAYLTINTASLNLRSAPTIGDNILMQVPRNGVYNIIGRTPDNSWWQIQAGTISGWVSGSFVIAVNTANVPVTSGVAGPITGTGYTLRAIASLNIRSGAGTTFSRIGRLPYNAAATIVGRNAANSWWMVSYGGVTGWVSGNFVSLPTNINIAQIPVR